MNMKKTFAGAMAGALAVSAMATSASASKVAPGNSYDIDLTKEAEFYATVEFTFDNTYLLDKAIYDNGGNLALHFDDATGTMDGKSCPNNITSGGKYSSHKNDGLFDIKNAKYIEATFEGVSGTQTQTVTYNTDWDSVNFYNWNLYDYNYGPESWQTTVFNIPVKATSKDASNVQAIYLDKYKTANEAYAVNASSGAKIYPVVGDWNADKKTWTKLTPDNTERDTKLDTTVFEKITVTAKFPVSKKFTLDELNGKNGYKGKLSASIKGLSNINVLAIDNEQYLVASATLNDVLKAQAALLSVIEAEADVKKDLADLNKLLTGAGFKAVEKSADAKKGLAHSDGTTNKVDSATMTKINDAITVLELSEGVLAKAKAEFAKYPEYAGYDEVKMDEAVERAKRTVDAYKDSLGVSTVGVDIADSNVIVAETKFTKFESTPVGVRSGVINDNGTIKTVAGDIGAWKPDALRKIADAIADYEGVTLTFTAKDDFDDAAYRGWHKGWYDYVENVIGGKNADFAYNNHYNTDSVKDDYEVWGESMFTGAIVLNRDFSKQFSQSNLVDWGTKTITFDWDELTEGRFYDASVVLHTMEILSTQNVEWVLCTVTIPEQEAAEVVDPSQGATDNSDEITDAPVETAAPEVITEAPATEAPATEAPAPVAPVTNPTTGNAPVALAVIPVALAAAAVVAKKRG